jgi:hypothetical protein
MFGKYDGFASNARGFCMHVFLKAGERGAGGGEIYVGPGSSAQPGPEISVKCSYHLSSLYVSCPK